MAKDRLYTVSFRREANNMIDWIIYHCWAANAPQAKIQARHAWETKHINQKKVPHMFELDAHRTESQVVDDLRVKTWLYRELAGNDVMHRFIITRSVSRRHGRY